MHFNFSVFVTFYRVFPQKKCALFCEKEGAFHTFVIFPRKLHFLWGADADQIQAVGDDQAHRVGQLEPGGEHLGGLAADVAGIVEPVEVAGQGEQLAVATAGIVVPHRQVDLLGQLGQVLDEGLLLGSGEDGGVHRGGGGHAGALLG